jgi:thioredoxin-related protein
MKFTFMLLLFVANPIGQEWLTNLDAAKIAAGQENKFVLLNFSGSDWCAPCIKLKEEVFESEAFQTLAAQKLILVRADFPRQKKHQLSEELIKSNDALAEKYNQSGKFPLTLLLDSDGKIIRTWDGYVFASQEKFMRELQSELSEK